MNGDQDDVGFNTPAPELPPIEAYADDLEPGSKLRPSGEGATQARIRIRPAADVAATMPSAAWLLRPYIERDAIAILYGDYETYKSFVALDWSMRIALGLPALGHLWPAQRADVVFISAEGRGLGKRLRAWCIRHCPDEDYAEVLARASLYCIEHPVNLSDPSAALSLVGSIDTLGIRPGLIVIDTMSRNSNGEVEKSTTDAGAYLTILDQGLRARYRCAILLTHHVGHTGKDRIRGPIILAGNTDALIRIERPDVQQRLAVLTVVRLKDSDTPPPQTLKAAIVELGETDEDDQEITSLALEATVALPAPVPKQTEVRGKAQRQLLMALRHQNTDGRIWAVADIREVGKSAGMHRNSVRLATDWLTTSPHLTPTVGGWKLV